MNLEDRTQFDINLSEMAVEMYTLFVQNILQYPEWMRNSQQNAVDEWQRFVLENIISSLKDTHSDWHVGEDIPSNEYKSYSLVVTPVDGEGAFQERRDEAWAAAVALVDNATKEPLVGVVAQPAKRIVYFGIKGSGAYVLAYNENKELILTNKMPPQPVKEFSHFSYTAPITIKEIFDTLSRKEKNTSFISFESSLLGAVKTRGMVAYQPHVSSAAVVVIVNEIGGKVTDLQGNPWSITTNSFIAARNEEDQVFLRNTLKKVKPNQL